MERFDLPPQGAEELRALLEYSGVDFRREGDRFRFFFASRGCRWQTVCQCRDDLVLVYGVHPARVTCPERSRAPLASPVMMPRAVTAWAASSSETAAWAPRAGTARDRARQQVSRAVNVRFFIAKTPFV